MIQRFTDKPISSTSPKSNVQKINFKREIHFVRWGKGRGQNEANLNSLGNWGKVVLARNCQGWRQRKLYIYTIL